MKYQLPFGTYGMRGIATAHPFTKEHLKALGMAIELWMNHNNWPQTVLIGSDTRASSPRIKQDLCAGFSDSLKIFDAQIIPTPGIIGLLKEHPEFGCGIVITASHNPAQDNGIKLFLRHGQEFQPKDQKQIQFFFDSCFDASPETLPAFAQKTTYSNAFNEYFAKIKEYFPPLFLSGLSIGLDCANGATSEYAPLIFEYFGARVTTINTSPNGNNINEKCGSNETNDLKNLVISNNLSYGFAFDGDGDRVIAISDEGKIKNGDDLLFIISSNPNRKRMPVIGTTMSNSNLKKALRSTNQTFYSSDVGEFEVIKTMEKHKSNLGGEPSGHIILKEYLMCSDGIFAALATLNAALITKNQHLSSFTHQQQAQKNIVVPKKIPLETPELHTIIQRHLELAGENKLLIRYSGTESILRILLEAETIEQAESAIHNLACELTLAINELSQERNILEKQTQANI